MREHQKPETAPDGTGAMLAEGELVAQVLKGRAAAFSEIMRRNNRRLFRTARSVLRDDAEAEDVVQEAYVRAFRSLADFRGHASLSTWLTRIALNEALGRLRRRQSTIDPESAEITPSSVGANILMFPTVQAGGDPENAAACREIRRLLEEAIDGLPEAFRVVLVARDVDGMSIEETAQILDIKSETVRTRLHRARHLLRQVLERRLGDTLQGAFPFDGARCARLSNAVLTRLGLPTPGPPE